ncbi:hypothetical protein FACS189483_11470 [Spirochaetia bacterium]|nr:hypothetical protein FACS189483_11470 [Spirochaetia bacterium]
MKLKSPRNNIPITIAVTNTAKIIEKDNINPIQSFAKYILCRVEAEIIMFIVFVRISLFTNKQDIKAKRIDNLHSG